MRTKIRIIIIMLVLTSCSDFLEILPETNITQENFYQTESDFLQAITGAYAPLQTLYNQDWQMTEFRSDNAHFVLNLGNRGNQPREDLGTFTVETNNEIVLNKWLNNYLIISRSNFIIQSIDNADFNGQSKTSIKGEAYFLRAFAYFDLLKNFGGVPLFIEPPTSFSETFKNRSGSSEILDLILSDINTSIPLLPGKNNQVPGRATVSAAYMLLADVLMSQKRWSEAESALRNVLNAGYNLLPVYDEIFKPSNEGNSEIIFEIYFVEGTSQPLFSTFPYQFLPELDDPAIITGVSPAARNGGGSFNIPVPELLDLYEDNDSRYEATIAFFSGPSPLPGVIYDNLPYIKKYQHPHAIPNQTGQNWIVYRYAETLLNLAECLFEQGNSNEALSLVNQIRTRAGLQELNSLDKNTLLNERRIELAFENKRWQDLVRSGIAVEVMNQFGERIKANPQDYFYPEGSGPLPNMFNVSQDYLLYPIPASEIILNPNLTQNPGY
ncbi:RagB/SusD family nutrient uptake outer membrane protein [Cecembia lonarensis]|nr:RagB/SusD family nutrient uptake outer membrane protein [Cecembia lonarensis]